MTRGDSGNKPPGPVSSATLAALLLGKSRPRPSRHEGGVASKPVSERGDDGRDHLARNIIARRAIPRERDRDADRVQVSAYSSRGSRPWCRGVEVRSPMSRPFTPDQVAERWSCSANHVRNLIKRGELSAFRLGTRLLRIPAEAVEDFERCLTAGSDGSTGATSSLGGATESAPVIVLRPYQPRTRNAKP